MPGLVPGIHVLRTFTLKDMDGRGIGERRDAVSSNGYTRP